MNDIISILMSRDGMKRTEAELYYEDAMSEVKFLIHEGWFDDAEYVFSNLFSLELDYLYNALI